MIDNASVTVLNVEDDEAVRYAKSRILQHAGFTVREASTGAEALQIAEETPPDIMLLDVKLPDINGFEVCRRIKANPVTKSILVVQASAVFVEKDDKVRGLEGGADGYLSGPVQPDELIATIRSLVRLQQAEEKLQKANEELTRQAEELRRSNDDLQQFAYVVSHDLQEPLRMVATYVQLLANRYRGKLDADADEFINYTSEGVTRMQALIFDLLSYARIQAQEQSLIPTNCEEVLTKVLEVLRPTTAQTGAVITHDALPTVLADATQLGQVLQNLLSNALKFHGSQPPRIHISAKPDGAEWIFAVQDQGIGLEPQFAKRIFVIFQRLHTRKEYPGTGIGLSICKKIIERHNGRIWVESEPGKGATFFFTLPRVNHYAARRITENLAG